MYKLFLIDKKNNSINVKEFDENELKILNSNINELIKNSKLNWPFYVIKENFESLLKDTDKEFNKLTNKEIKHLDWEQLEITTKIINKNLFNYLTSLNTFLDHSQHYLSQNFGDKSNEYLGYKTLQKELYDNNFAYRLFYNLRNYTVHCGYSLNSISIEQNQNKRSFTPKFIIEELKEFKKWQADLKKDFSSMNDDLSAFDLAKTVLDNYSILNDYLQKIIDSVNSNLSKEIFKILNIKKSELNNYCFRINDNGVEKISQIPIHYL